MLIYCFSHSLNYNWFPFLLRSEITAVRAGCEIKRNTSIPFHSGGFPFLHSHWSKLDDKSADSLHLAKFDQYESEQNGIYRTQVTCPFSWPSLPVWLGANLT